MDQQIPMDDSARVEDSRPQEHDDGTQQIAINLAFKRLGIANVIFYGQPGASDRGWVLIDAGVMGTRGAIEKAAAERFGPDSRPSAIVMTHGHFDHVGALEELSRQWDVPVYAHELEAPYLNGSAAYPPPDPSVGGGMMALLSPLYPRSPVNVSERLHLLPHDNSVPPMPGWKWVHTPGHTPGHVSLWHEQARIIIAGDAFITTRQESAYAVAVQKPEMHGPPAYFTPDWEKAKASVRRLAALQPDLVITGHGPAMAGDAMRQALQALAQNFDQIAVPEYGKYVGSPARAEDGTAYIPANK